MRAYFLYIDGKVPQQGKERITVGVVSDLVKGVYRWRGVLG